MYIFGMYCTQTHMIDAHKDPQTRAGYGQEAWWGNSQAIWDPAAYLSTHEKIQDRLQAVGRAPTGAASASACG